MRQPARSYLKFREPASAPAAAEQPAPGTAPVKPTHPALPTTSQYGQAITSAHSLESLSQAHNSLLEAYTKGKVGHHEYMAASSNILPVRKRLKSDAEVATNERSRAALSEHRKYIASAQSPDDLLDATRYLWHDDALTPEHRAIANRELNVHRSNVTNFNRQQNVAATRDLLPQGRRAVHTEPGYLPLYPTPKKMPGE